MNARHDNADGPEDIDKAFAEIVAGLERDTALPQWPDGQGHGRQESDDQGPAPGVDPTGRAGSPATAQDPDSGADPFGPGDSGTSAVGPAPGQQGPRDWTPRDGVTSADDSEDEGHYEPPEPPPVPTPRAGTVGGVALILVGLALLLVPGLAGWAGTLALPAGLVAISAGIGWLLFRMRHSPPESGWDDGAQL